MKSNTYIYVYRRMYVIIGGFFPGGWINILRLESFRDSEKQIGDGTFETDAFPQREPFIVQFGP